MNSTRKRLLLLVILVIFDTVTTAILYRLGVITEANPLMEVVIRCNITLFVVIKMALLAAAVVSILWFEKHSPVKARHYAALAASMYFVLYVFGVIAANH